jgi:glycosyltransferase involved in cell wall biosynthesis
MEGLMISVVIATLNRLGMLKDMINSLYPCLDPSDEIIVVDGMSKDGTADWCRKQGNINLIEQVPTGAIVAFDIGFEFAHGEYVANLNDDCIIHGNPIKKAVEMMEADQRIGQVAIPYTTPSIGDEKHVEYTLVGNPARKLLYANFGVVRRYLGHELKWWRSDIYKHYCGDSHFSVELWRRGYQVIACPEGFIEHIEKVDETRHVNDEFPEYQRYWSEVNLENTSTI